MTLTTRNLMVGVRARLRHVPMLSALAIFTLIFAAGPTLADDAVRNTVEQIIIKNDIQRDLSIAAARARTPNGDVGGGGDGSGGSDAQRNERSSNDRRDGSANTARRQQLELPEIGDPGPVLTALLWVLVGALAIVVGFHALRLLRRTIQFGGKTSTDATDIESLEPLAAGANVEPQLPPDPLAAAEVLARTGRYDEAVHLVLLIALEQLKARFGGLGRSLTSLEVVRQLPLETQSQRGLSALVSMVQLSRFGGRGLGEADYRLSVGNYHDVAGTTGAAQ